MIIVDLWVPLFDDFGHVSVLSRPLRSIFLNGQLSASISFILAASKRFLHHIKIVDVSGVRTQRVGVEGEHADHLTTTNGIVSPMTRCRSVTRWLNYFSIFG